MQLICYIQFIFTALPVSPTGVFTTLGNVANFDFPLHDDRRKKIYVLYL